MKVANFDRKACERIQGYLDFYLNNELLIETTQEVLKHLEECKDCSQALEARLQTRDLLRKAVERDCAPQALQEKIKRKIRENGSRSQWSLLWRWWSLAAALVLLAGGSIIFRLWNSRTSPPPRQQESIARVLSEQTKAILKLGMDDHIHCISQQLPDDYPDMDQIARQIGSDCVELPPLVKQRMPEGYKIADAHRCQYNGREFVHVILRNRESVLSVIVTKKNEESFPKESIAPILQASGVRLYEARLQELEVAGFETRDYFAFVVSGLARENNIQIASSLAPAVRDFLIKLEG